MKKGGTLVERIFNEVMFYSYLLVSWFLGKSVKLLPPDALIF